MAGILGEVHSFFSCAVTTTYYRYLTLLKQWACTITDCTSTDTLGPELLFRGQVQTLGCCTCCDDDAVCFDAAFTVADCEGS